MLEGLLGIVTFLKDIANLQFTMKNEVAHAIIALRTAIRETRRQINQQGYLPNDLISDLWLIAFTAFQKAGLSNRMLYDKARFWEDPQRWINEPSSMELIPTLNDLERMCENLLMTINAK